MAISSLSTAALNHRSLSHASSLLYLAASLLQSPAPRLTYATRVASSHSNPKILKSNRRSRHGHPLSPYDTDDDARAANSDELRDEEDDNWSSDDEFGDIEISETDRQRLKLKNETLNGQGRTRHIGKNWDLESSSPARNLAKRPRKSVARNVKYTAEKIDGDGVSSTLNSKVKEVESSAKNRFGHLSEELDLDERYFPLLNYLSSFGLKERHFLQMYERHMPSLQINVESAEERLEYLLSIGVKHRDIQKIILRQPQILQYTVENNLKAHVAFLCSLGIPSSRIGQIIAATPSLFSYSVENSLKPTVKYLKDEIGIQEKDISKVVQLSPQILVQRIDSTWKTRLDFLMKELDAPRQSIVKMVTKHPQLLHYSIEDGLLPRINFLRSIGMQNSEILKVLTSLTQVFSLSLEANLKPKYKYLVNELQNEVHSLTKYPTYLSLSLDQRIRPRHRFLVSLKKAPKGPFPLSSFVPTDESFCRQWAGTSVDKYLDFRQRLLLKDLAKKYERQ
ncbi:transcription termination factor MTERF9, chloroplastic [Salvia hispanica]|uniref:transcription termination factor MTERF9, chloroplastic n=1 Tax=Salvia hispanica TaxID=49212 RepID=UPI002009772D|nr:transcription termination factor MTERF9, chloroplastic [Salvia hispanica]XP_047982824.1 transcription termination factor MTERF9, chloroplastic [Salvia hispanica]XP_047982825.1 transcription termination factor MTERF9, chloroplastic [Salvia hispanica]XP_047982826.1 transcription termination factor MTERF9, chloroplastic [Salvia hispanica]XP_047982827.1 transcription termination factor MTERF9, chloroplastic [Salvia hispanica]